MSRESALASAQAEPVLSRGRASPAAAPDAVLNLYETEFEFVWRSLCSLGVPRASLDDAVQDVFMVVHRRLGDFEQRSSLRTWLFGIVLRVAANHRRKGARRAQEISEDDVTLVGSSHDPQRAAEETEAAALVQRILAGISQERRAVFLLIELEEFSAQEVAQALGVGVNTVYSRLRLARRDFDAELKRIRARNAWSER